jgi:hypothetical protein
MPFFWALSIIIRTQARSKRLRPPPATSAELARLFWLGR